MESAPEPAFDPPVPPTRSARRSRETGPMPALELRAGIAQVLFVLTTALTVASIVVDQLAAARIDAPWIESTRAEFSRISYPLSFGAFIALVVWLHRAVVRLKYVPRSIGRGPWWSVLSWFVPIFQLWVPFVTFRELARKSRPDANLPPRALTQLRIWWAAMVLPLVVLTSTLVLDEAVVPDRLVGWVIVAGKIVAGVLTIRILGEITESQRQLFVPRAGSELSTLSVSAS